MKILRVIAEGDYDALDFENLHTGEKASDIITKVEAGEKFPNETGGDFYLKVYEVGEVDPKFLSFVRDELQDYDDSKHSNFYLENETIK